MKIAIPDKMPISPAARAAAEAHNDKEAIEILIARFDFATCRRHMIETGWTWAGVGVPGLEEMQETVRVLARSARKAVHRGPTLSASGGFRVARDEAGHWSITFQSHTKDAPIVATLSEAAP